LCRVVLDDGAKKDIGVGNDLHSPAPDRVAASLMTSLICSTVSTRPFVLPFRHPAKARNANSQVSFGAQQGKNGTILRFTCFDTVLSAAVALALMIAMAYKP